MTFRFVPVLLLVAGLCLLVACGAEEGKKTVRKKKGPHPDEFRSTAEVPTMVTKPVPTAPVVTSATLAASTSSV